MTTRISSSFGSTSVSTENADGTTSNVFVTRDGTLQRMSTRTDPSTGALITTSRTDDGFEGTTFDLPDRTIRVSKFPDGREERTESSFEQVDDRTTVSRFVDKDGVETTTTRFDDGNGGITETVEKPGEDPQVTIGQFNTLPDGSSLSTLQTPDGRVSRTITFPNGSSTMEFEGDDGVPRTGTVVVLPDGSTVATATKGGEIQSVLTRQFLPDGIRDTTSIPGQPDEVRESHFSTTADANGRVISRTTTTGPNGVHAESSFGPGDLRETSSVDQNGVTTTTSTTFDPDGTRIDREASSDGTSTVSVQSVDENGVVTTEIVQRDGDEETLTTHTVQPDGTIATRTDNPDGSFEERTMNPDGSGQVLISDADGIQTIDELEADTPQGRGVVFPDDDDAVTGTAPADGGDDDPITGAGPADPADPDSPFVIDDPAGVTQANGTSTATIDNDDGSRTQVEIQPDGTVQRTTVFDDPDTGDHIVRIRSSEGLEVLTITGENREASIITGSDGSIDIIQTDTVEQPDGTVVKTTKGPGEATETVKISTTPEGGTLTETTRQSSPTAPSEFEVHNSFTDREGNEVEELVDKNGILRSVTHPDGSSETILTDREGVVSTNTVTIQPDGSQVTVFQVGDRVAIREQHWDLGDDGEVTSRSFADGRPDEVIAIGRESSFDDDGNVITRVTTLGPGDESIEEITGPGDLHSKVTVDANGDTTRETTTVDDDGTRVDETQNPDGSVRRIEQSQDDDGDFQTVITNPDGTRTTTTLELDGTAHSRVDHGGGISEERNIEADGSGSVVKEGPDGKPDARILDPEIDITDLPDIDEDAPVDPPTPPLDPLPIPPLDPIPAPTPPLDPVNPPIDPVNPPIDPVNPPLDPVPPVPPVPPIPPADPDDDPVAPPVPPAPVPPAPPPVPPAPGPDDPPAPGPDPTPDPPLDPLPDDPNHQEPLNNPEDEPVPAPTLEDDPPDTPEHQIPDDDPLGLNQGPMAAEGPAEAPPIVPDPDVVEPPQGEPSPGVLPGTDPMAAEGPAEAPPIVPDPDVTAPVQDVTVPDVEMPDIEIPDLPEPEEVQEALPDELDELGL